VEPFGIVVAEAMASGKAVVCTDSGGVREIVADGVNGFLVPPGDPATLAERLSFLLSDHDTRGRMGREGRRIAAEKLDWKAIAARTKRLYEEVLAGNNP
jgi:glycosyltransferase involved in cell wall biosynthesis